MIVDVDKPLLCFTALGEPMPQGSKTIVQKGGLRLVESGNFKTKRKPAHRLRHWRSLVGHAGKMAMLALRLELLDEPLHVGFAFTMTRPGSHITHATKKAARWDRKLKPDAPRMASVKPDLSKLIRAAEDALQGIVYKEDSRILTYPVASKQFDDEGPAGVVVTVWRACG